MAAAKKQAPKKSSKPAASSKKTVVKKSAKVVAPDTMDPRYVAAFEQWKSGTRIADLARKLDLKRRSTLRRAFRTLAGGKKQFIELRAAGAGGTTVERVAGAPRKSRGERRVAKQAELDSGAIRVTAAEREGWSTIWLNGNHSKLPVAVAPDNSQYIPAEADEPAQFLFEGKNGTVARMIRLDAGVRR